MSGYDALLRQALRLVPDEPDQVPRLSRFRAAHPEITIGTDEFGTWHGVIPDQDREAVRYTLRELLDRLDELTGHHDELASGGG